MNTIAASSFSYEVKGKSKWIEWEEILVACIIDIAMALLFIGNGVQELRFAWFISSSIPFLTCRIY